MLTFLLASWWSSPASAQPAEPAPDPGIPAGPAGPTDPAGPAELPVTQDPQILEYVEAPYPEEAAAQGLEAVVKLRIELDEAGEVQSLEVISPAGHGFDEAAVDAVLAMKFSPARTEAGPVPVIFEFEYGFVLRPAQTAPSDPAPAPVNLEGTLLQMGTRRPIPGATVVVVDTELTATTDADGRFAIRGVPVGTWTVRILEPDHVTTERELEIVAGEVTTARLWLRSEAYRDNELVATYQEQKEEVTRRTITIEEIRRVPGTFGDPVKVVQTLPGAARSPFGTGFLIIRGSNPEDSGVYIDGVRIPLIYHLTGTTSVLAPDLIESVDYLPGGYGMQYGRSMGGVVDVKTRTDFAEQGKLVWGTDILDSQLYFEGKLGKSKQHGLAIGGRRSYIDVFIPIFTGDTGFVIKPRYLDYQVKWVPELSATDDLSLFFYGFDDLLRLSTPDDVAQGRDADTQGDFRTQYGSQRLILTWRHRFSEDLVWETVPSVGFDSSYFGLGNEFLLDNSVVLGQLRSELRYQPIPEMEVVPGLDLWVGWWGFDFKSAVRFEDLDDPLAEREAVGFDGRGSFLSPDPFLKLNLRPLEGGSDRWLLTPGARLNVFGLDSGGGVEGGEALPIAWTTSFDPRVLTRFQVTPDKVALKAATGLYHQPPQPQEALGVGTQATVGHERSWSSSVGFEHRLNPAIHYDVDLFYKRFERLILFDEAWDGFGSNPYLNGGDGRAYGLEVIARHDPVGRLFGWVSYTLSRASRRDTPYCTRPRTTGLDEVIGDGRCWYPFDFDQTHILSAQAGYDLPRDFGISAQVQYVTGNPSTEFNAGVYDADGDFYNGFRIGGYNDERLPPFFQTSLRFDKLWTFKRWQLETYVDLINAVRGVNPELAIYNYDYSQYAYVRGLPFIPNVGLEAKFWL